MLKLMLSQKLRLMLPNRMQRPMLLPNLMPLPQQMLLLLKQHSFNLLKNASQLSMFLKNNWTSNSISSLEHSMTEDIRTPESSMMLSLPRVNTQESASTPGSFTTTPSPSQESEDTTSFNTIWTSSSTSRTTSTQTSSTDNILPTSSKLPRLPRAL